MTLNFLILEDDPVTVLLIESLVKEAGHAVSSAFDTDSAMELVENNKYDALIADWSVPGTHSTRDIAERLTSINANSKIALISGYSPEEVAKSFQGPLVPKFYQKPVDYSVVIDALTRV